MTKIYQFALYPAADQTITLDSLAGVRYYVVRQYSELVGQAVDDGFVVMADPTGELADPTKDPLIVGILRDNADYTPVIFWRDRVWRVLNQHVFDLLGMLAKVKVDKLADAAHRLGLTPGLQQISPGGPPDNSPPAGAETLVDPGPD